MRARFWRVVGAQLLATLGVLLLALTVIGIPFALWKLVGWSFVQQEVIFTDKGFRESFRASSELVRGRWLRTARVVADLLRDRDRDGADPDLRADLHGAAADLDQPDRLASSSPC